MEHITATHGPEKKRHSALMAAPFLRQQEVIRHQGGLGDQWQTELVEQLCCQLWPLLPEKDSAKARDV